LPELPVQYADYAAWQRDWLSGEVLEEQLEYWRTRLAGAPPLLEIPTDRPRRAEQSPRAGSHRVALSAELSRGVREISRREGVTLFMTVLAAWQVLLGRYAGQEDVVVGSPIAGRNRQETEGLIGFFVNMLPLRAGLEGDPTWTEILGRVREAALGAYDHQELPFERLVEDLGVERSLTHTPVFQASFSLDRSGGRGPGLRLGDLRLEPFGSGDRLVHFDLDLGVLDTGEELVGGLRYREALFDPATTERMATELEAVVEAMVADPRRRFSELSLLRGAERARVLVDWNATAAELPRACIHELFAAQASRTPHAAAVIFQREALTYAGLDAQADRIAHVLRSRGVRPDVRVAIGVEKGPVMALGILAVLKAGGAYVPLDLAYPAERVAFMIRDSGAALLLTETSLAERFSGSGLPVLALDALGAELPAGPVEAPDSGVSPENLAYVIYTSGSTGTPKGVAVPHRALVNYAADMARRIGLRAEDRVLQFASPGFDVVVEELFPTWLHGAAVVFSREELFASETLLRVVAEEGVSAFELPTAYWDEWVQELVRSRRRVPECVRLVLVGGERIAAERLREWAEQRIPLVHVYGLTETACTSTTLRLEAGDDGSRWSNLPVGRPTGNVRLYVLDAVGQPVSARVPGELFIGGEGLARGYLDRPALTAERFLPDPFGGEAGARLYRTGDRVQWNGRGEVEFLGRVDQQVKIRGFRIEPGEIEAALVEHGSVGAAAVTVREDAPGRRRLVAYVVAAPEADPSPAELRAHLRERLPEYMVPGAFVALERLPLNASGKLDRRALPAPEREAAAEGGKAPRTATEEVLSGIWTEVLGVEGAGMEESFFDLGGHSLLATQVVSRARQALGVEVPLRTLFEAPTIAGLAERVEALRRAGAGVAPPMERVAREGPLPVSFAQQRLWLVDRIEPGSSAYNVPHALRLRGVLDVGALRGSLDELVRRHETLRTTFAERDGVPVQVVHPPAPVPLPVVDLGGLPEAVARAERLAKAEAMQPFDLARGPLLRSTLLRLEGEDHVLCFTLHHVVSDGWSMDVLVREVSALYAAFGRGERSPLPELPVQYADYAAWQRDWLSGEVLEEQLEYWRTRLAGAPPLLEIPTARPRAAGQSTRVARHHFELPHGVRTGVGELSRREGTTLFMTVLAAWQVLLGRYAGQEDVVVGSPIAGRNRRETEGLIGFFVNMLALRADLGGDPTWTEMLGRVREAALGAYDHQDLPFERLVEELAVERSLTHTPLFQAIFSLNRAGGPGEQLRLGDLSVEPFGGGEEAAKFDLNLVVAAGAEALSGALVYRAELFEPETMARVTGHLEVVLGTMVADPRRRLSELSLLRAAERAQVLEAWGSTPAELPPLTVHELFARQAARAPHAIAVTFEEGALTYGELERGANRLAHRLRRLGVGPETRVAVCAGRSLELVVALLAVLKAGAAYVPVDPSYPAERVAYLLDDSGCTAVLVQEALRAGLPSTTARVLSLGAALAEPGAEEDAPGVPVDPQGAAYVIYTSGSTGTPKGVVVTHANVARLFRATDSWFGFGADDVWTLFHSYAFDFSVWEIWGALLHGGRLVVVPFETSRSPGELHRLLAREGVTVLSQTPSAFRQLVRAEEALEPAPPLALRYVVFGGEALEPGSLRPWMERHGEDVPRLINMYGITETTVHVTYRPIRWSDVEAGEASPVGTRIPDLSVRVADPWGNLVPAGVAGELYVGGAGVARGYLGRPELTAERFVPDPFSGEPGARMYRSGDRARWLAAGELEYLGRIDFQVKVRGFRIELGEVEAALVGHPSVREAVVTLREDAPGDRRLVGYVVPEGGAVSVADLRAGLKASLPEYMLPSAYVVLEELPLTGNGKIDRRALPAPEWTSGEAYVAPRTPVEEVLAGIWGDVLGAERVGA
ncbi:MAG TPA: amino acid adenylation domain-containing protein, partial [Longimicrobiaceae bacterium]